MLVWFIDVMLVMPSFLLLAILSPTFKGKTWLLFVVLLAAFAWMISARIVRSLTLTLKNREFVLAARYMGVPAWKIIVRHILPNMASLLIIDATIGVAATILGESGLSYFGFGIQPPDVSLGTLISHGAAGREHLSMAFPVPGRNPGADHPGGELHRRRPARRARPERLPGQGEGEAAHRDLPGRRTARRRDGSGDRIVSQHLSGTRVYQESSFGPATTGEAVLDVRDLSVAFPSEGGTVEAVRGVSYRLRRGEVLGIVGESGSGKSVSAMAVLGLLPETAQVAGSIRLDGRELLGLHDDEMSKIRGKSMAMVFQDPLSALTPVYSIGTQIIEALQIHPISRRTKRASARSSCWTWSASRIPSAGSTHSRTSSPAVCVSVR